MKPIKCPASEKKTRQEKRKKGEERKRKVKVKTAVSLLNPKTCPNFASKYFASGLEGREVNDLQTALWWVLALYSTTATRKPLDYRQNALFRKISRNKWVNSCEASGTVMFFTAETVILKVHHLNGCIHLNKIERIKKDGLLCSPWPPSFTAVYMYLQILVRTMADIFDYHLSNYTVMQLVKLSDSHSTMTSMIGGNSKVPTARVRYIKPA